MPVICLTTMRTPLSSPIPIAMDSLRSGSLRIVCREKFAAAKFHPAHHAGAGRAVDVNVERRKEDPDAHGPPADKARFVHFADVADRAIGGREQDVGGAIAGPLGIAEEPYDDRQRYGRNQSKQWVNARERQSREAARKRRQQQFVAAIFGQTELPHDTPHCCSLLDLCRING